VWWLTTYFTPLGSGPWLTPLPSLQPFPTLILDKRAIRGGPRTLTRIRVGEKPYAHGAFMTLPPYIRIREGETRQLGGVVRTPAGRAFKL